MSLSECRVCSEPVDVQPGGPSEHVECRAPQAMGMMAELSKAYKQGRAEAFEEALKIVERHFNLHTEGSVEHHLAENIMDEIRARAALEKKE